jgi:hypothetical protein
MVLKCIYRLQNPLYVTSQTEQNAVGNFVTALRFTCCPPLGCDCCYIYIENITSLLQTSGSVTSTGLHVYVQRLAFTLLYVGVRFQAWTTFMASNPILNCYNTK